LTRVVARGLLAIAGAAATWALFMRLAPQLDFGLVFFVSIMVGLATETLAAAYLKRMMRARNIAKRKKQRGTG